MNSQEILDVVKEYFSDYFGKEYKGLISERLGKTDFDFINKYNFKEVAGKHVDNINATKYRMLNGKFFKKNEFISYEDRLELVERINKVTDSREEDVRQLAEKIREVVISNEVFGKCIFSTFRKDSGDYLDIRRGAFVRDFKGSNYENTWLDDCSDMLVCHELLHAATMYICNNGTKSGINKNAKYKDLNEWLTDSIVLEVVKKMHADGIRFNERTKPSKENYYFFEIMKLKKLPKKFFHNYKSVLKPAMLTGNNDELYNAFGGQEKFEELSKNLSF